MSDAVPASASSYSRAFENFVTDGDGDIVGLLAYGLFKQSVREAALAGDAQPGIRRNPSPTSVKVHRDAAERLLSELVDAAIEAARPTLEESALRRSIKDGDAGLRSFINERTSFWLAVLAGIVAWLLSLVMTIIIIWLSGKGDAVSALLK